MNADETFMQLAIEEGERARLLSPPNPWVGCVLVKNNQVIGKGHTQPPGLAHAEVAALEEAGGNAQGATAYVTLEPCSHFGRTPPCSKALIAAKIRRVVIALEDPDQRVFGKGALELRQAGIDVVIGICAAAAENSLRPYLHHRKTGRAYCLIKTAISIDGRVAAQDGTSQWITCKEARLDAHRLRAASQAIMVGSRTALADMPALTVRNVSPPREPPRRLLFDRRGLVPACGPLFDTTSASTEVFTTEASPKSRRREWAACGATVTVIENDAPFETILSFLGTKGIIQLMVEGGAALQSSILQQGACQELVTYVGPLILGDLGLPAFKELPVTTLRQAPQLCLNRVIKVGNSTRIDYFLT